jgi:hydrogenase maturation factor HypF (carbamoyltransferase family)
MKSCFDPVVNEIIKLIQQQITDVSRNVKAVILAGGFGESRYLQHRIREAIHPIQLLFPGDLYVNNNNILFIEYSH